MEVTIKHSAGLKIATVAVGVTTYFFLAAGHAHTDINLMELSVEQLLNVKVHSASKKEEAIGSSPVAIYAITSADIERSGVTNIPDALRMVPGVEVAQADSNSWAISIRGFNSTLTNKLLVLVDGRTIYNPVFGGVLWESQDLVLEDIDRIEVIRGPGGALWGANAVNGVINIITKHSRETQGTLLSAIYGNEEMGTLSARYGDVMGDGSFYRVYAKAFKRDASHKPNDLNGNGDTYDAWDGFRGGFRVDWANEFTLQGEAYRTNTEQLRTDYAMSEPYTTIEQQTIVYEGANLLGRWVNKDIDESGFTIQSYVDWSKRDEPFNFVDDRITIDFEAQYDFLPSTRQEIIVGAGFRYIDEDKQGNNNVSFSSPKDHRSIYNLFIHDKITLVPHAWFLSLGAKIEHDEFSGVELQPNLRLQWQATEIQSLWTAVSRAVRTPTPIETDLTSTLATGEGVRVAFTPNPDFQPEKLLAYELGYRNQITSRLSIDLTTFYNDYQQLTTFNIHDPELVINSIDPPHFLVPVTFTNNMEGTSSGFEAIISWNVGENLLLTADYSYLHISLDAGDPSQEGAEYLSPEHQLGARIFWDFHPSWTLGVTTTYVDKLPASDVDDYVRMDINLGGKISQSLRLNLVGQNLLDSAHREFGSIEDLNVGEVQRSIFAKVTLEF